MPCQLQNRKGILDQVVSPQRREKFGWHGLVNQKWGTPRFSSFTLWLCQNSYWKWPINSGFSHQKWWFSIAMLNYQRVTMFKTSCSFIFAIDTAIWELTCEFRWSVGCTCCEKTLGYTPFSFMRAQPPIWQQCKISHLQTNPFSRTSKA